MYEFTNYKTKLKPETLEELSLTEFRQFWYSISYKQILSESFMNKYSRKLNWHFISWCQKLSLKFLFRHNDKIISHDLAVNSKISEKTKDKFYKEIISKNK